MFSSTSTTASISPTCSTGRRARGTAISSGEHVTIHTSQADKRSLYLRLLHARFTDAVAAMRDPTHDQLVTVADAAAAVDLAVRASQAAGIASVQSAGGG